MTKDLPRSVTYHCLGLLGSLHFETQQQPAISPAAPRFDDQSIPSPLQKSADCIFIEDSLADKPPASDLGAIDNGDVLFVRKTQESSPLDSDIQVEVPHQVEGLWLGLAFVDGRPYPLGLTRWQRGPGYRPPNDSLGTCQGSQQENQ